MATFIMSFALGMAIGSAAWGWLGFAFGISMTFIISALVMILSALFAYRLKIGTLKPET